jgi:hypothetical protein
MKLWFRSGLRCSYVLLPPEARCPTRSERLDEVPAQPTVIVPTDLMFAAWRQVFPPERMVLFGGRKIAHGIQVTSVVDVTGPQASVAHVRACPALLAQGLRDFDRTGVHLAVWMHSHPGEGITATYPSSIDVTQERDLRRHYSDKLISVIAVRDGWLRVWGRAIEDATVSVGWSGQGIERHPEAPNVYRFKLD